MIMCIHSCSSLFLVWQSVYRHIQTEIMCIHSCSSLFLVWQTVYRHVQTERPRRPVFMCTGRIHLSLILASFDTACVALGMNEIER